MNKALQDRRAPLVLTNSNRSSLFLDYRIQEVPYSSVTNRKAFSFCIKDRVALIFFIKGQRRSTITYLRTARALLFSRKLRTSHILHEKMKGLSYSVFTDSGAPLSVLTNRGALVFH